MNQDQNQTKMVRQGDVLLIPVAAAQPNPLHGQPLHRRNVAGHLVLAEGESSLHEHVVIPDEKGDETEAELIAEGERMLLHLKGSHTLATAHTHDGTLLPRHDPITIAGGTYEVRIQRRLDIRPQPAGSPRRAVRVAD